MAGSGLPALAGLRARDGRAASPHTHTHTHTCRFSRHGIRAASALLCRLAHARGLSARRCQLAMPLVLPAVPRYPAVLMPWPAPIVCRPSWRLPTSGPPAWRRSWPCATLRSSLCASSWRACSACSLSGWPCPCRRRCLCQASSDKDQPSPGPAACPPRPARCTGARRLRRIVKVDAAGPGRPGRPSPDGLLALRGAPGCGLPPAVRSHTHRLCFLHTPPKLPSELMRF